MYLITFTPQQARKHRRVLIDIADHVQAICIALRGSGLARLVKCEHYEPVSSLEYE